MTRSRLLVVEDKAPLRKLLERILSSHYDVESAADANEARAALARARFALVLTDVRMPGGNGLELLRDIKRNAPDTEVVVMTAYASVPDAVEAIRCGAYDYVTKPFDPDDVALVVARALAEPSQQKQPRRSDDDTDPTDLAQLSYRQAVERARERSTREYLAALLHEFNGNVTHAAARAGIERESLHRLLRRYGLHSESFK